MTAFVCRLIKGFICMVCMQYVCGYNGVQAGGRDLLRRSWKDLADHIRVEASMQRFA